MAFQLEVTTGRPHTSGRVEAGLRQPPPEVRDKGPLLLTAPPFLLPLATQILVEATRARPRVTHRRAAMPARSIVRR